MHPITQQIVTELDVLYGLYQMAVDINKRVLHGDDEVADRVLEARAKILEKSGSVSQEVISMLKSFQAEKWIPSNEKALVEEKRSLVLDMGIKIQAADNQVVRFMQSKLQTVRAELAEQTERKNVIKAYIQAPQPYLQVQ